MKREQEKFLSAVGGRKNTEFLSIYKKKKQMRLSYFKPTGVIQVRGGGK